MLTDYTLRTLRKNFELFAVKKKVRSEEKDWVNVNLNRLSDKKRYERDKVEIFDALHLFEI